MGRALASRALAARSRRRPCHDRHWPGPAAAAADPWQGVISTRNRTPHARLCETLRGSDGGVRQEQAAGVIQIVTSASLIGRLGSSAFRLSTNSSVDVAHGLSLLFGLGTKGPSIMGFEDEVEQSFGRPCRQCDGRFKRTYELTSSIVPRGTSFHRGVELDFLLLHWILHSSQATATSLVHRNSVPSTHTRCMITANRRASATIAFFIPRCLATFIAQALSQDHFVERTNMLWAAS